MYECQLCGNTDAYIHFGTELLCLDCYNEKMFNKLGIKATSYPEGVTIRDCEGKVHRLRLRKRLDPIGIIMEAKAEESDGYQFIIHGELYVDQDELFLQLIANFTLALYVGWHYCTQNAHVSKGGKVPPRNHRYNHASSLSKRLSLLSSSVA
ncbi:DUF7686 domain-containing protein [Paenisporosarcina antarctica]|uniref:DUF7686 domain-containing protein n=1 Tax=Paenisporosarcina antarctica TaxID=417367 RepID=UPI001FBB2C6F|nr:hypothetical protein [Paenisporosarcina antarctica]